MPLQRIRTSKYRRADDGAPAGRPATWRDMARGERHTNGCMIPLSGLFYCLFFEGVLAFKALLPFFPIAVVEKTGTSIAPSAIVAAQAPPSPSWGWEG